MLEKNRNLTRFDIGFSSSVGESKVEVMMALDGEPHYSGSLFYQTGLILSYRIFMNLWFESGVNYAVNQVNNELSYYPDQSRIRLIEIPLNLRVEVFKYLFLTSGVLVDFTINPSRYVDKQNGIGLYYGLGGIIRFKSGLSIFGGPVFTYHAIFPFDKKAILEQDRLTTSGFKIGLQYAF